MISSFEFMLASRWFDLRRKSLKINLFNVFPKNGKRPLSEAPG
jgi:hypothetical protein